MVGLLDAIGDLVNAVKGISSVAPQAFTGGITIGKNPELGLLYPFGTVPGNSDAGYDSLFPASYLKAKSEHKFLLVDPQNWYKIFPYQFTISIKDDQWNGGAKSVFTYTLPIPPEAYSIKMHQASEATPTFGGVVEETSMNKFWTVNLAGTTGMAVTRAGSQFSDTATAANQFRKSISTTGLLSGVLGNIESIGSKVVNTVNAVTSFANLADNPLQAGNDLADLAAAALQPNLPYTNSAVDRKSNGYSEIARLHKFFYIYTLIKEKRPHTTFLTFRNVKDRQVFRCVVKDFTIQKSVQDPYLYRYNIQLKCWHPQGATKADDQKDIDRFGAGGDLKAVNTMTLTGMYAQGVKTMQSFNFGKSNVPGIV